MMKQQATRIVELLSICAIVICVARTSDSKPTSLDQESNNHHHHHFISSPSASASESASSSSSESASSQDHNYMNYVNQQRTPLMQVHKLSSVGNNVTCNDGSQIGYYKRLNQHSKSWVIYLQGGGFCGSSESCRQRWHRTPFLMSSKYWPNTRTADGILSSDPKENPYLWNANHIYVPYCSSDSWTGSEPAASSTQQFSTDQDKSSTRSSVPDSFAFLGSKIVERVFESLYDDLPLRQSLYDAKFILLAGDSAGATGVILNLDKMAQFVEKRATFLKSNCTQQSNQQCELTQSDPVIRGLADSGWFLDNEPYNFELEFGDPISRATTTSNNNNDHRLDRDESKQQQQHQDADCDQGRCTPLQSIKQAMQLWNGQVPEACIQNYLNEPWRCYFGYRVYQTLRTPLFVVQWLYDEAQLMVDNIVRPGTNGQWNYVNKVVNEMRTSLENVTALFAPSCLSHSLIARKSWNQININGFRLPHILNSWEEQPLLLAETTTTTTTDTTTGHSTAISSSPSHHKPIASSPLSPRLDTTLDRQHHQVMMRDAPSSGLINQPTFETVLIEQLEPQLISSQSNTAAAAAFYLRSADRLPVMTTVTTPNSGSSGISSVGSISSSISGSSTGNGQAKSRSRKRKRNNQQQQNKIKQNGRQRSNNQQQQQQHQQQQSTTTQNGPLDFAFTSSSNNGNNNRETNDLQQQPTLNPIQDLLPTMDRSLDSSELLYGRVNRAATDQTNGSGIRLGRSTIVDDATLMLGNNVPDDNSNNNNNNHHHHHGREMSQLTTVPSASVAHSNSQDQSSDTIRWSIERSAYELNHGSNSARETSAFSSSSSSRSSGGGSSPSPNQFRFIDSCGWPQCNRDCPVFTYEFL